MHSGYPKNGINKGWFIDGPEPIKLDEDYICSEYSKGRSAPNIAKELRVSANTIHRRLNKNKVARRVGQFQKGHKMLPGVEKSWFKSFLDKKPKYKKDVNGIGKHRLIMEKHIGRKLKSEEVIHHINGDGTDNSIENLKLFNSQSEHMKEHIIK